MNAGVTWAQGPKESVRGGGKRGYSRHNVYLRVMETLYIYPAMRGGLTAGRWISTTVGSKTRATLRHGKTRPWWARNGGTGVTSYTCRIAEKGL